MFENEAVLIGSVRFLIGTLWAFFQLLGDMTVAATATQPKNDCFRQIKISPQYREIKPSHSF